MEVMSSDDEVGDSPSPVASPGPILVALAVLAWAAFGGLVLLLALAFAGVGLDVVVPFGVWGLGCWLIAGALHFRPWARTPRRVAAGLSLATLCIVVALIVGSSSAFLGTDAVLLASAVTLAVISVGAARSPHAP
jgi:hypothetical protein